SERFFPTLSAPFYGFGNSSRQNDIALVLDTDETLREFNKAWPLPFATHAFILNQILDAGPKAIFVDIMFPRLPRAGECSTDSQPPRAEPARRNIPIYFARGRAADRLPSPLTGHGVINVWD